MESEKLRLIRHDEFVTLFVRHEAAVFSFVLAMVRNTADAEDVVQRASVTMWKVI